LLWTQCASIPWPGPSPRAATGVACFGHQSRHSPRDSGSSAGRRVSPRLVSRRASTAASRPNAAPASATGAAINAPGFLKGPMVARLTTLRVKTAYRKRRRARNSPTASAVSRSRGTPYVGSPPRSSAKGARTTSSASTSSGSGLAPSASAARRAGASQPAFAHSSSRAEKVSGAAGVRNPVIAIEVLLIATGNDVVLPRMIRQLCYLPWLLVTVGPAHGWRAGRPYTDTRYVSQRTPV
jgi:hypothetical protein